MEERVRVERKVPGEPDPEPAGEPDETCKCRGKDAEQEESHLSGQGEVDGLRIELRALKHLRRQDRYDTDAGCSGRNPPDESEEPEDGGPPVRGVPVIGEVDEHREDDEERHVERGDKE